VGRKTAEGVCALSLRNSPGVREDTISWFSTEKCIVCLIVIIIKIGQSAANLFNSFDIVFLKSQEFSEETSSSSFTLDLEEQATNEEQEEESDDLSADLVENDLSIEEGSSETTRENELFVAHGELPVHRPHHTYPKNEEELGYYLAGLIDGDGYISNEENQPTITITFHKKDTFLAYKIKSLLGYGSVRCYSSYSIYTITNREGLIKMLYLIYNKLRLIHKVNRSNKLIEKYNLPLNKAIPDNSNVTLTHYLAGLLDSDGSLTIKLLKRKRGLKEKETIEVRLLARVEMSSLRGSNVINKLKADIGGSLSIRSFSYAETRVLGARMSRSIKGRKACDKGCKTTHACAHGLESGRKALREDDRFLRGCKTTLACTHVLSSVGCKTTRACAHVGLESSGRKAVRGCKTTLACTHVVGLESASVGCKTTLACTHVLSSVGCKTTLACTHVVGLESASVGWNSVSFKRMHCLLLYLDRYNLCSKKYLEYLYIRKAYLLIQQKKHLTSEGLMKISYFHKRVSELKHLE